MFSAHTYTQRRNALRQKMNSGLLLFLGNEESPMNYTDNTYHFRQDSNFLYFFGIDKTGMAAIIDLDNDTTTLFGDDLSVDHIVWTGPQPSMRELADGIGVATTAPFAELTNVLRTATEANRSIHYLPPYRDNNSIRLSNWLGQPLATVAQGASAELVEAVIALRAYKTDEEIAEAKIGETVTLTE